MRAVVTRVKSASVAIGGAVVGKTDGGFLVLLGVHADDGEAEAEKLASKITQLRVFEDESGKMNRSLADVGGSLLVVSQFTLYADCKKGNRPSFIAAARPEKATALYERFVALCRERGVHVETGEFGADMLVTSENDGPVTIIYDTREL
jgi:D-tyrosyl-tRNA(Tyr) deacylase